MKCAGLGVIMLLVETFIFVQKKLHERGDPLSRCLADSQKMRFLHYTIIKDGYFPSSILIFTCVVDLYLVLL